MYRVPANLDLSDIVGAELQQLRFGPHDVQFQFGSGIGELLGYIGLGIVAVIAVFALLSETGFKVIALIPGHYILLLFKRVTGSSVTAQSDAAGELSITVGTIFWVVIFGAGYVAYRLFR